MKKLWLLFAQLVTVLLAVWLVLIAVQPRWLPAYWKINQQPASSAIQTIHIVQPPSDTLRSAAKRAAPAVVSVITNPEQEANIAQQRQPGQLMPPNASEEGEIFSGVGSGVLVSKDGYILTNNHVLESSENIEIQLSDGRRAVAKIIGTDPDTDLAVLKIELGELPFVGLGDSSTLQVGDPVLAIGNPFGVGQTVTSGIVSALGRSELGINTFENFIQTDAAINPGNSGGALIDIQGNLVGINTAIYSRTGGYMGIGFATPTSTAKQVLDEIINHGYVTRGWIGVEASNINAEIASAFEVKPNNGVMVTGVIHNSPAALAQLMPGDIIYHVNGKKIRNMQELLAAVSDLQPGIEAKLSINRKTKPITVVIVPWQRPKPQVETAEAEEDAGIDATGKEKNNGETDTQTADDASADAKNSKQ